MCLLAEILGWQVQLADGGTASEGRRSVLTDSLRNEAIRVESGGPAPTIAVAHTECGMCRPLMAAASVGVLAGAVVDSLQAAVPCADHSGPADGAVRDVVPPRLIARLVEEVIHIESDDPDVNRQLARLGFDRLVPPVPLAALEQLLMFAA